MEVSAQVGSSRLKVAVVMIIVVLAFSSMVGIYALASSRSGSGLSTAAGNTTPGSIPLSAQLSIKVYDKGVLQSSVTKNGDLVMNNFMNFLQSWMSYVTPTSSSSTFTMTDTTGTLRTLVGRDSSTTVSTCSWACETTTQPYAGGYIAVGTGTASPTRTDYKLGTQYQSLVAVNAPTYDPSTGNIVFGAAIIAGTAATISEAGFFENWYIGGASWANFLMFHDTFTTIAVAAGSTISVQYTVELGSTAYNNNFGTLLAAVLANSLGASTSVKLTPTSGTAQTVNVYVIGILQTCYGCGYYTDGYGAPRADLGSGSTGADSTIEVGTGSTSTCPDNTAVGFAQSRSAINLCNPVLAYQPVNSYVISPYVAVTAVIPTSTAYSLTEAGYFQSFGSGSYSFLLIRNTFSALSVPADSSATVTYEMSMG